MNGTQLRSYLTGLILGDAHIDNGVHKRALRIKSISKDFVEKIYTDLSQTTNFNIFIKELPAKGMHKEYWELVIKAHPYFSKIYHYFYTDYRDRYISDWALKYLDLQGLANWYMSDGYITLVGRESGVIKHRRIEFCTDRYGVVGADKLAQWLIQRGYLARSFRRGNVYRVRVDLETGQNLLVNLSQYVVPSMMYKLYLAYEYRPTWMSDAYYELMLSIKNSAYPRIFG